MGDDSRIWIGGLPEWITEDDIKDEFQKFGSIKHVQIRFNTGKPAFAFAQYGERREAEDAIKSADQAKLFGMAFVKVAWAGQRTAKGGGGKGKKDRQSRSPRRRSSSRRRSPSRRRSGSRRRSPSRRRSRSRPRSPSQKRRSPSPRRRSPSQRRRSPTPKRRSPSPKRRSPSPRHRSQSPRRDRAPPRGDSRARKSRSPPRDAPRKSRSPRRSHSPQRNGRGRSRTPPRRSSREPQRRPPPSELHGKYRVIVENLPKDMDWQELKDLGASFAKSGQCTFARTRPDRSGELEYTSSQDMDRAIKELDRRRFSGSDERLKAYEQR